MFLNVPTLPDWLFSVPLFPTGHYLDLECNILSCRNYPSPECTEVIAYISAEIIWVFSDLSRLPCHSFLVIGYVRQFLNIAQHSIILKWIFWRYSLKDKVEYVFSVVLHIVNKHWTLDRPAFSRRWIMHFGPVKLFGRNPDLSLLNFYVWGQ